jgi:hypothetical protein
MVIRPVLKYYLRVSTFSVKWLLIASNTSIPLFFRKENGLLPQISISHELFCHPLSLSIFIYSVSHRNLKSTFYLILKIIRFPWLILYNPIVSFCHSDFSLHINKYRQSPIAISQNWKHHGDSQFYHVPLFWQPQVLIILPQQQCRSTYEKWLAFHLC